MTKIDYSKFPEYDNHQEIHLLKNEVNGLQGVIAIHYLPASGLPAFGATRLWNYQTAEEAIRDALRLSKLMSYKSALAGLPYGGAKGVIIKTNKLESKKNLLRSYINNVNNLKGKFVTGSDVGIDSDDVKYMRQQSEYIIGLKIDPAYYTALGLIFAIQECCLELFGNTDLKSKQFAIQGLGKVGEKLAVMLVKAQARVYASDIDKSKLKTVKEAVPPITIVAPEEIQRLTVDFFCPCALNTNINSQNIKKLQCCAIVGGANNQLADQEVGDELYHLGILYAPDYVVNAGGLISVADEYKTQQPNQQRIIKKLGRIKLTLKKIFQQSKKLNKPPHRLADQMAEEIIKSA